MRRKLRSFFLAPVFLLSLSCAPDFQSNRLGSTPSPYLRQHSQNPVWWQPWEKNVLRLAKEKNKLIFLSVGYSTCHWCHVMEKNVFSQKSFSEVANKNFVTIKIDREQRPDLDAHFMKSLQAITPNAGWPITLVLTPDLHPIFGATYVPLDKMIYILEELQKAWTDKRDELKKRGQAVFDWAGKVKSASLSFEKNHSLIKKHFVAFRKAFDTSYGGRKGRVKFPINDDLRLLLRHYFHTQDPLALKMADETLFKITKSTMFDHLGGGFHRYSTNPSWTLPHFEKMLYDQASFLNASVDLYKIKPRPLYKTSIQKTLSYLFNEMQHPEGGFYSAQDADALGKEGLSYSWAKNEIQSSLSPEEFKIFQKSFRILPLQKNLHNRQLFIRIQEDLPKNLLPILEKLKTKRLSHPQPLTDQKIITAWNGLLLEPLAKIGRLWPSTGFRKKLSDTATYLLRKHKRGKGRLYRYVFENKRYGEGTLDDYAFLICGLIEVYQTTQVESFLREALQLQLSMNQMFRDPISKGFFYSGAGHSEIQPFKVYLDNVRPSAQSVIYENLIKLGSYFQNADLIQAAKALANSFPDELQSNPLRYSRFLLGLDFSIAETKELVISGNKDDCYKAIGEISQAYFPHILFSCSQKGKSKIPMASKKRQLNGVTTYYVCKNSVCLAPTTSFLEAKNQLIANPQ